MPEDIREEEITVDYVGDFFDRLVETYKGRILKTMPFSVAVENMAVFFRRKDGVDYQEPELKIIGGIPGLEMGIPTLAIAGLRKPETHCIDLIFDYRPDQGYRVEFHRTIDGEFGIKVQVARGLITPIFNAAITLYTRGNPLTLGYAMNDTFRENPAMLDKAESSFEQARSDGALVTEIAPVVLLRLLDYFVNDILRDDQIEAFDQDLERQLDDMMAEFQEGDEEIFH